MSTNGSWPGFSAFQVFGDHVPLGGFSVVVRLAADSGHVERLLESRASGSDPLDPELAKAMLRAGLGLMSSGLVSFVYANTDETAVLVRPEAIARPGRSMEVHDELVSLFAARVALLSGRELPVHSTIYELPDLDIVCRAFESALDRAEQSTPARCSWRLGAQMRGRGEPFHVSMLETLEEQMGLLAEKGVDLETLPTWLWRGVAARARDAGVEVYDQIAGGEALRALVRG